VGWSCCAAGMNWGEADLEPVYRRLGLPLPRTGTAAKRDKFNARKKQVDGHLFASTKEARVYLELKALQSAGVIADLELQPRFRLQDGFRRDGKWHRPIDYVADFAFQRDGRRCVVDVKSKATRTAVYRMKVKMLMARYQELDFQEWM